jgi:hypothetical protein
MWNQQETGQETAASTGCWGQDHFPQNQESCVAPDAEHRNHPSSCSLSKACPMRSIQKPDCCAYSSYAVSWREAKKDLHRWVGLGWLVAGAVGGGLLTLDLDAVKWLLIFLNSGNMGLS